MAKTGYIGVDNISRKAKKLYIGVDGVARKVKAAYIGVDNVARQWHLSEIVLATFYVKELHSIRSLQFVKGQTFKQWVNSEYNTIDAYFSDSGYVQYIRNGFPFAIYVTAADIILENNAYTAESIG